MNQINSDRDDSCFWVIAGGVTSAAREADVLAFCQFFGSIVSCTCRTLSHSIHGSMLRPYSPPLTGHTCDYVNIALTASHTSRLLCGFSSIKSLRYSDIFYRPIVICHLFLAVVLFYRHCSVYHLCHFPLARHYPIL
jgi:hypothetical protein